MSHKISLEQILTYSKCPKKYSFDLYNIKQKSINKNDEIIKNLIKEIYINRAQDGYTTQWETVKSRIDKICFKDINIKDKTAFNDAYNRSKNLLSIMHTWYYKYFSLDKREGLVNLTLDTQVDKLTISHTYDLIILDPNYKTIPIIFALNNWDYTTLHNNLYIKLITWMLYKNLGYDSKVLEYWIPNSNSIEIRKIFNKTKMDILEKYINFIVRGIEYDIFYPSVNEQCNTCEYKNICTF